MVYFVSQAVKTVYRLSKPAKSRLFNPFFSASQKVFGKSEIDFLVVYKIGDAVTYSRLQGHSLSSIAEVSDFEADEVGDDAKAKEKDMALSVALSQLEGDGFGDSALSLLRLFSRRDMPVISTGSLNLDRALKIGGLPKGRIVEIYGQEASGKTTLALQVIKEAQKLGGYCAYFDVENALDPTLAESMGLKTEKLLIAPPDSAENLLSAVNTLTKSGSVDVIVVDSVAALLPHCEIDVQVGATHRDVQSRILGQALRKIHYSLCHSETLIIFVNQVRFNPRSIQGHRHMEEQTCGGNALKFYTAVRIGIKRKGLLKSEDKISGLRVFVQVVKNKLAPAMKNAELNLEFGKGICRHSEVFDLACEHGVIMKEGSNYLIEGKVFNNIEAAQQYLFKNSAICENIVAVLRKILFEGDKRM